MGLSSTDASSVWARSASLLLRVGAVLGQDPEYTSISHTHFYWEIQSKLGVSQLERSGLQGVPQMTLFQQQQCHSWNRGDLLETSQALFSFTGSKTVPEFLANFGDYRVLPTEQITDGTTWNWEFESLSLLCEVNAHFSCDNHWAAEWFGELPVQKNSWKYLT